MNPDKYIEDALHPFSLVDLQLVLTIRDRAAEYGASLDDVVRFTKQRLDEIRSTIVPSSAEIPEQIRQSINRSRTARNAIRVKCPDCSSPVNVTPVNVSRCTNVGGNWHSSLMCSNPRCRFTELSEKTVAKWAAEGRGE